MNASCAQSLRRKKGGWGDIFNGRLLNKLLIIFSVQGDRKSDSCTNKCLYRIFNF